MRDSQTHAVFDAPRRRRRRTALLALLALGMAPLSVITAASGARAATSSGTTATLPPAGGSNDGATTSTDNNTGGDPVNRLYGNTRIGTAIAISLQEFPKAGSASAVVLARSDNFADALAGGPLAAQKAGPLLLTEPTGIDPATGSEISRVLPQGGTVYILGGSTAVSPSADAELTNSGYKVVRLAGADRFATGVAIVGALGDPSVIFEATGLNYPDALAAGPAAVTAKGGILLTNGTSQAAETASYLQAHSGDTRYALGGPAAAADASAMAIVGQDRFDTAAKVASQFFSAPTQVAAADGLDFPDALAGGPFTGVQGAPMLLVDPTGALPSPVTAYLNQHTTTVTLVFLFGGTSAVSDQVENALGNNAKNASTASMIGSTVLVSDDANGVVVPVVLSTDKVGSPTQVSAPVAETQNADGSFAFAVDGLDGTHGITPVDMSTSPPTVDSEIAVSSSNPVAAAISKDGSTAWLLSATDDALYPVHSPGSVGTPVSSVCPTSLGSTGPSALALSPDGTRAYVACTDENSVSLVDLTGGKNNGSVAVNSPSALAVTPDGNTLVVTDSADGTLVPIDLTASTVTAGTAVSVGPRPDGVAITPDGKTALVANGGGNSVTPVRVTNASLTAGSTVSVGSDPVAIAIAPDGTHAATANFKDGTCSILTLPDLAVTSVAVNSNGQGPTGVAF